MADGARVHDVGAIRGFRAALVRFLESSNAAVAEAEAELLRRQSWCENEQTAFWQRTIRKLQELIGQLKEQIRMKKLFKDSSGRTPSAFDEEKKLRAAQQKLDIAEQKLAACRRWAKQLQKEHLDFRGGVQRLQTMLSTDLVVGVAKLDGAVTQIEHYLTEAAPSLAGSDASGLATSSGGVAEAGGQMRRSAGGDVPPAEPEKSADPATPAPEAT